MSAFSCWHRQRGTLRPAVALEAAGVLYYTLHTIQDICRDGRRRAGSGAAVVTAEAVLGDTGVQSATGAGSGPSLIGRTFR